MKDYTGKKIYLGIDVHKTTYAVAAFCEKIVIKKATLPASPEGLVTFCKKYFPGAILESASTYLCFSSFEIDDNKKETYPDKEMFQGMAAQLTMKKIKHFPIFQLESLSYTICGKAYP